MSESRDHKFLIHLMCFPCAPGKLPTKTDDLATTICSEISFRHFFVADRVFLPKSEMFGYQSEAFQFATLCRVHSPQRFDSALFGLFEGPPAGPGRAADGGEWRRTPRCSSNGPVRRLHVITASQSGCRNKTDRRGPEPAVADSTSNMDVLSTAGLMCLFISGERIKGWREPPEDRCFFSK